MADVNKLLLQSDQVVTKEGTPTLKFLALFNRIYNAPKITVSGLPVKAQVGQFCYATDLRVFNGAGTKEGAGNGTGGLVSFNGTNWVIAGTNSAVSA